MDKVPDEVLEQILDEAFKQTPSPLGTLYDLERVSKHFRRLSLSAYLRFGHCLRSRDAIDHMKMRGLVDISLKDMETLYHIDRINLVRLHRCDSETLCYIIQRWQTRHILLSGETWGKIRKVLPNCRMLTAVSLVDHANLIQLGSIVSSCKFVQEIELRSPRHTSLQELQEARFQWRTVPFVSLGPDLDEAMLPALRFFLEQTTPSELHVWPQPLAVSHVLSTLLVQSVKDKLTHLSVMSGTSPRCSNPEYQTFPDPIPMVTLDWKSSGDLADQSRQGKALSPDGSVHACDTTKYISRVLCSCKTYYLKAVEYTKGTYLA